MLKFLLHFVNASSDLFDVVLNVGHISLLIIQLSLKFIQLVFLSLLDIFHFLINLFLSLVQVLVLDFEAPDSVLEVLYISESFIVSRLVLFVKILNYSYLVLS